MTAIDASNTKRTLGTSRLVGKRVWLESADSFQVSFQVCHLLKAGFIALFGPQSYESSSHVQSMAASMGIPHLEARIDFKPPGNHSVNLMPSPYVLVQAFRDLVSYYQLPALAIVYGSDDSLPWIQEFVKDKDMRGKTLLVRRTTGENNKEILDAIKSQGIRSIILDLPVEDHKFHAFMRAARDQGMLREYYNYISTSLDLERTLIPHVDASILLFSLLSEPHTTHTPATALTRDAVQLLTESLAELRKTKLLETPNLTCGMHESWPFGTEIRNQLLKTQIKGLTGEVKFNRNGIRSDVKLRLIKNLGERDAFTTIGSWTPLEGIRLNEDYTSMNEEKLMKRFENKTLVVVTSPQYNAEDGYLSELLSLLQSELDFQNVTIRTVNKYGYQGKDGQWTGQVGELVQENADMTMSYLTITPEREEVIDFTVPFYTTGLQALIKKSDAGNMTSLEDLANQDAIVVGAPKFGSTPEYLRTSNESSHRKLWEKMDKSCPSSLMLSTSDGLEKVKAGGFAYITDSLTLEHEVNNSCDLQTLGDVFAERSFGIGLPKGSPYTAIFSKVLLKLEASGKLQELKDRHFRMNPELECYRKP